jgi:leucyl-tRNA synthetase
MGFDAFGLPAEQYALETGQHPEMTTKQNIARYKEQLDLIGFCYDWEREVQTSDPAYYRWTQWIFLELYESWYNRLEARALPIASLVALLESEGNNNHPCPGDAERTISAEGWNGMSKREQEAVLMQYRLAYQGYARVWWCEALGTVLANDEVVNGVSERGNYPVERREMRQWFLRITEYSERLLSGLDSLDWTEAMKDMQRNWIGKSVGGQLAFEVEGREERIEVFTTRPDTLFGVDFLVLAPEHELVAGITTAGQAEAVEAYQTYVKSRSERERMAEVKQITGVFTGAFAKHPFTGRAIPIWISEYVLAGYGTGAIMAVPAGDSRDHAFAKHFEIGITNIFGDRYTGEEAYSGKEGTLSESGFLSGLPVKDAISAAISEIEKLEIGKAMVNYRLRDAGFSRQRYWGEPFPIFYQDGVAMADHDLPVVLPKVDSYRPGPEGEGPLANISEWVETAHGRRETSTMPGYAGSSWYFLRYMDPRNKQSFADRTITNYWREVDVYIGGTEHAVGHLLYSRMWTKVLYDLGHIGFEEPYKKLVNQGMIQGASRFVFRERGTNTYISHGLLAGRQTDPIHVDVSIVDDTVLDMEAFRQRRPENRDASFETENGQYICGSMVEKMSKSKYNVVSPDDIVAQYGADTFRLYEMFLGPLEVSKPWDTKGIEGVHRFLKKLWRLYVDEQKGIVVDDSEPGKAALKALHKTIKKVAEDIERFAFNTVVSQFMICVNELTAEGCRSRTVLEPLSVLIAPFAPHIAEELWQTVLGKTGSVLDAPFPEYLADLTTDDRKLYPVAVNGKTRAEIEFAIEASQEEIEAAVMADAGIQKWLEGKAVKKVIFVKGKMINLVV